MDSKKVQKFLEELLWCERDEGETVDSIRTFEDVGLLTSDDGLVVRMKDNTEFQITIVRSK